MLHTKSLIRRLVCVPWLLTAGLVLGLGGEAAAKDLRLKLDTYEVYEHQAENADGDQLSVKIKVTATLYKDATAAAESVAAGAGGLRVELGLTNDGGTSGTALVIGDRYTSETPGTTDGAGEALDDGAITGYGTRFRVDTLPPIVFGKDDKSKSVEITFYPLQSAAAGEGPLLLGIVPNPINLAATDTWQADTVFRLNDDDETAAASLIVGGDGALPAITDFATATSARWIRLHADMTQLNNEDQEKTVKITAHVVGAPFPVDVALNLKDADLGNVAAGDVFDSFLSGELGRRFDEAIDDAVQKGVDDVADRDGDYETPTFPTITIKANKSSASANIKIDPKVRKSRRDDKDYPAHILIAPANYEVRAAFDNDGTEATQTATTLQGIRVVPAVIEIIDKGVSQIKAFTPLPIGRDAHMIREGAGDTTIDLEVELGAKVTSADGQPVGVEIIATGEGTAGTRDDDYQVRLGDSLTIPKGETKGIVQIIVSPKDRRDEKDDEKFIVEASISGTLEKKVTITIVDDDKDTKSIALTGKVVTPEGRDNLMLYEGDDAVAIEITATLNGAPLGEDAVIDLTVGGHKDETATRDLDYTDTVHDLTIKKGATTGSVTITIDPLTDSVEGDEAKEAGEKIIVRDTDNKAGKADSKSTPIKSGSDDITVGTLTIKLINGVDPSAPKPDPKPDPADAPAIAFPDDIDTDISGEVGKALSEKLPVATAADTSATVKYLPITGLPAGLSFDVDTRTIAGTPTAAGTDTVTYYATAGNNLGSVDYIITIADAPAPTFDVKSVSSSHSLLRERAGHATAITLTVTLAEAASEDTEVTLDFAGPSEGKTATRDDHFTAQWDADYPRVVAIAKGKTTGMAKVSVTPIDNQIEGATSFTVQATPTNGSGAKSEAIVIADDESSSNAIVLSVDPATVKENDGAVSVTVTATLAGGKLDEDVTVTVGISGGTATRDEDYTASFESTQITIASDASPLSGSTTMTVTPIADEKDETGEVIELSGMATDLATGSAVIALEDGGGMADMPGDDGEGAGEGDDGEGDDGEGDDGGMDEMPFAFAGAVEDQAYTAGTAIADLVVPAAENGEGDVTYRVFDLPAGLAFDAATRTISGTPEAATAGAVEVTVLAQDSAGAGITLTFNITVNAPLSFGDLFGAAGKIVPDSHGLMTEIREFVVGQPVEGLTLPEGAGGTAPLTYSLSPALPAGLTFDAVTRTIAGTPRAASETLYTYTVTDANGASFSMSLQTLPAAFSLADNFPNPFNPATTIKYALPQAADVELTVYNVLGQPVRTLVAEHQNAGRYVVEWDATNDSGHSLSSGMYFYRLQAGGEFLKVKKMLLLK